jgi:hypothetical protein
MEEWMTGRTVVRALVFAGVLAFGAVGGRAAEQMKPVLFAGVLFDVPVACTMRAIPPSTLRRGNAPARGLAEAAALCTWNAAGGELAITVVVRRIPASLLHGVTAAERARAEAEFCRFCVAEIQHLSEPGYRLESLTPSLPVPSRDLPRGFGHCASGTQSMTRLPAARGHDRIMRRVHVCSAFAADGSLRMVELDVQGGDVPAATLDPLARRVLSSLQWR